MNGAAGRDGGRRDNHGRHWAASCALSRLPWSARRSEIAWEASRRNNAILMFAALTQAITKVSAPCGPGFIMAYTSANGRQVAREGRFCLKSGGLRPWSLMAMATIAIIGSAHRSASYPTTFSNSHFITTPQSAIGLSNTSSTATLPMYE